MHLKVSVRAGLLLICGLESVIGRSATVHASSVLPTLPQEEHNLRVLCVRTEIAEHVIAMIQGAAIACKKTSRITFATCASRVLG